jgi:Ca2+-binding EF-hand superfamily protein
MVNWAEMRDKLPTKKTDEEKAKRMELFARFDPNGNGYLSLAEVDKGCRDVLALHDLFDAKPVIMRAFQAAKSVNDKRNKKGSNGPDYIEKCEFRLFLVYLRQYFEVWQMFEQTDQGGDRRVDLSEFKAALGKIAEWGLQIDDPEAEFKKIDTNGGGQILFDEFAAWALAKHLDLVEDDD